VLRTATVVAEELEVVLAVSGLGPSAARRWGRCLGADRTVPQGSGSLGLCLQRQVIRALREGSPAVLLIGTDLPQVTATDLRQACLLLNRSPLVLGPATDGGYWLIGLQRSSPLLFSGIAWGSDQVLKQTQAQARRAGLASQFLAQAADLDRPADLLAWR
jgi:rSAM/selenodomain-associated transferase 1